MENMFIYRKNNNKHNEKLLFKRCKDVDNLINDTEDLLEIGMLLGLIKLFQFTALFHGKM